MRALAACCCLVLGCVADVGSDDVATSTDTEEINNGTLVPFDMFEAVGRGACSGTLISDRIVLTAAHCHCGGSSCPDITWFTFKDVRPVSNPSVREDVSISGKVIGHPDFNIGSPLSNDIAVIRLDTPASQHALVTPIPVANFLPLEQSLVTLVGWGWVNTPGGDCNSPSLGKTMGTTEVDDVVYWAAPSDITLRIDGPDVHTCPGDSGGPTIQSDRVVGVHSTGDSDKATYAYREWIAMQNTSPGGRVGAWDLGTASPAAELYDDNGPDPNGLLGWIDWNDLRFTGDFFGLGHDQVLYVNRGGTGGLLRIADYADGNGPTNSLYWESYGQSTFFAGWLDSSDAAIVGDFMHRGRDQLLLINRSGVAGRVMIVDFATGAPQVAYQSTYATDPWFNGWHDTNDALLAGDFRGLGHDQLMFINRGGAGGRVLIVDFRDGIPPGDWVYYESYSDGVYLNGWHDSNDLLLAGDFRQLGRDQVMFINRGPGAGRVLITDFGDGWFPAEWLYYEAYGWSTVLDGWHDTQDVALAGDFRGLGFDQVAFVNRNSPWFGRAQVLDFRDGAAPAEIRFFQNQAQESALLQRIDANDLVLAGEMRDLGRTQLFTLELLEQ